MGIIFTWLAYVGIILAHELAHYWAADNMGITVKKIVVGFPTIFKKEWRDMEVQIGLIPLVGYVVPDEEEYDELDEFQKAWFCLSGPAASILTGYILLVLGGADIGGAVIQSFATVLETMIRVVTNPGIIVIGGTANPLIQIGMLSLTVAGLNLLPFPPLDGGNAIFEYLNEKYGDRMVVYSTDDDEVTLIEIVKSTLCLVTFSYLVYSVIASRLG